MGISRVGDEEREGGRKGRRGGSGWGGLGKPRNEGWLGEEEGRREEELREEKGTNLKALKRGRRRRGEVSYCRKGEEEGGRERGERNALGGPVTMS